MRLVKLLFYLVIVTAEGAAFGCHPVTFSDAVNNLADKNPAVREHSAHQVAELAARSEKHEEKKIAVSVLVSTLHDQDAHVRAAAALALGVLGERGDDATMAVPELVTCLHDSDDVVRCNAVGSIYVIAESGESGNIPNKPDVVKALIGTLHDKDNFVRAHAVRGLIAIAPEEKKVVERISRLLMDPDMNVQVQVLRSLGELGAKAKPYTSRILVLMSHTSEDAVREEAQKALNLIDGRGAD